MHAYLQQLAKGGEALETSEEAAAANQTCPKCGHEFAEAEPAEEADAPRVPLGEILSRRSTT